MDVAKIACRSPDHPAHIHIAVWVASLLLIRPVSAVSGVRVTTGDGGLGLELDAATGFITGLELGGERVTPARQQDPGGFSLSEYLGDQGPPCSPGPVTGPGNGPTPGPAGNVTLLQNGDFALPAAASPDEALGWAKSAVTGYTCTGYRRVTCANMTRPGDAAATQASAGGQGQLGGASRRVYFTPTTTTMFQTLVLSGWSRAEADANSTPTQPQDYSVYADVEYGDGSFSFGEAATFSAGAHDWEFSSHAFRVPKPVKVAVVYAMYRNRIGSVYFSDLALTGVPPAACMPGVNGTVHAATSPAGNRSVANWIGRVAPSTWNGTEAGVTATFEALADHIRVTGAVALTRPHPCPYPNPCPPDDAPADRAVSLQLAFPLAGAGWRLWSDPETAVVLPPSGNVSIKLGGQSEQVAGLPHTLDRYPMLVLTSPDSTRGILLAVPMTPAVQIYRIEYDAHRQLFQITFDFGLTSETQRYPSMATFECLLMPVARPMWGFRAGLQSYFSLFPEVWATNIIRNQGIWGFSIPDVASIPHWRDFGLVFAEEATEWNVTQSRYMNQNGVLIFPCKDLGTVIT